jgi:hypothetical protein
MMGAHNCGDLIAVDTSHTLRGRPQPHWPNGLIIIIIIIIIMLIDLIWLLYNLQHRQLSLKAVTTAG